MTDSPYRQDPPPRAMQRWFYWSPWNWRRWQVLGVLVLALGALGRRAGCFVPSPPDVPVKLTTEHGWIGWRITSEGNVDTTMKAGVLCPKGWVVQETERSGSAWQPDLVVIECQDRTKGY